MDYFSKTSVYTWCVFKQGSNLAVRQQGLQSMSGLKAVHFVVIVPIVLGLSYMLLHEDLSSVAVILISCLAFTTLMMFIVYKIQEVRLKEDDLKTNDGMDRSMFKVCKANSTPAVFKMLQDCTSSDSPQPGVLSILQYLRETTHADALVAVELVELCAIKHVIKTLSSKSLDPKSVVASLELVNEILSSKPAKLKLITDIDELQTTVDAVYLWLIVLLYSLVSELQLPPGTVQLSNSAITAISGMGVNLFELTSGPAVQFPAGQSSAVKVEQLVNICSKTLVMVGLLCSDECPDAQTRFTDRGGVQVLLSALNTALLMCSTASASNGIGAESSTSAVNKAVQVNDRTQRLKQSALLCKWGSWCLFNLTLEHPPSKAELFHSSGIRVLLDALKLHSLSANTSNTNTAGGSTSNSSAPAYSNSVHVHRQGLALLLNLIAPSPQYAQYAYSQAQARQMMMANSIVEVLENAKVNFKKEKDILTTCRAIANIIMVDYS